MMKKITPIFILLLSILMLVPGSARAEGEDTGTGTGTEETSSTIFKYTEVEGGISIDGFKDGCSAENLEIPSEIDGKPVVAIGNNAFYNQPTIKSIKIPSSVTTIGEYAFCVASITSIEIPSSVTTIGDFAFCTCVSLTSVTFADNSQLTSIGGYAFSLASITSIEIPSSVTTIGEYAFYECKSLASVAFATGCQLASIGHNAFESSGITSIAIPSSVTTIENDAFSECKSLTSVTFATGCQLTSIGEFVFQKTGITSIAIPSSVTTIGKYAFSYSKSLTSVTFGANSQLTSIGESAFDGSGITSIAIPSSVTTIENDAFGGCESLTSVTFSRIPVGKNTLEGYGENLFWNLPNFKSIYVPGGCEETYKAKLLDYADLVQGVDIVSGGLKYAVNEAKDGLVCTGFSGDAMTEVTIPAMVQGVPVTQIAAEAFQDASSLKYIYVKDEATYDKLISHEFAGSDKLVMLPQENMQLTDEAGYIAVARPTLCESGTISYERTLKTEGEEPGDDTPGESAQAQYATLCLPFALDLGKTAGIFDKVYAPMNTLIHHTKKSTAELEHFILMLQEQEPDAVIPAGQPVLVKLSDGTDQLSLSNYDDELLTAALQPKAEAMTVVDWDGTSGLMKENKQFHISYRGTFQPKEAQEADHLWTFNPDGTFGSQTEGTVHPFRLVLSVENENEAEGSGSEGTGSEDSGSEDFGSEGSETETPATPAKQYVISIGVSDGTTTGIREFISSEAITTAHPNGSSVHAGVIYDLSGRKVGTAANGQDVKKLRKGIYVVNGKKIVVK